MKPAAEQGIAGPRNGGLPVRRRVGRILAIAVGAAAIGGACPEHARAEEPPAASPQVLTLTLADALDVALRHSKEIRAARLAAGADHIRVDGAKGEFDVLFFADAAATRVRTPLAAVPILADDLATRGGTVGLGKRLVTGTDVELTASSAFADDRRGGAALNPVYRPELTLRASQDMLRGAGIAVNRSAIDLARNQWQAAEQALREIAIDTLFGVETAYWELFFAAADLRVRREQLERARQLVVRAEARARVGDAAPIEVTRAEASAARQTVAILDAENARVRLTHRLLRRLGIVDPVSLTVEIVLVDTPLSGEWRPSFAESFELALRHRPDVARAHLALDSARLESSVARNLARPRLQVYGELGVSGLDDSHRGGVSALRDGQGNRWEAGVIFEYPLSNRTARARHRAAMLDVERAETLEQAVVESIARDVADAVEDLRLAGSRIETAGRARDLATHLLAAEERSFNLGRSDSLDVLNAQSSLAAAERDLLRARTDYVTAAAGLLRMQGNLLEARGVTLDVATRW